VSSVPRGRWWNSAPWFLAWRLWPYFIFYCGADSASPGFGLKLQSSFEALQVEFKVSGTLITLVRILAERLIHNALEFGRDMLPALGESGGFVFRSPRPPHSGLPTNGKLDATIS
jgi:hypothetical protein